MTAVKRGKPKPPAFVVNAQPISGPMWGKLVRYCHGDKHAAGVLLYRARNADSIIKYLQDGMKSGTINNIRVEEENTQQREDWIRRVIFKEKAKPVPVVTRHEGPRSIGSALGDVLKDLGA